MSKELGKLIQKLRREKGFKSLRSFAKAAGKSPTFICFVEQGSAVPSVETLEILAELLDHRDEIFQAAEKVQPEIEKSLVEDSQNTRIYRKILDLTSQEKFQVMEFIEKNYGKKKK